MARTDDMPESLVSRVELDSEANFFIKDPQIPESYVIAEKAAQNKGSYVPTPIGTPHKTRKDYFLYEESVRDIGNGIFSIESKYAIVPKTWYSFESQSIPFTKFAGITITGGGNVTIVSSFLFGWLNLQGIQDVRNFDEGVYASSEQKQGSINCVVRVKHEYASSTIGQIQAGTLAPFAIGTARYEANPENGAAGNIDDDLSFSFNLTAPSQPIKFEAGKYAGNIYYNKTYEIVSQLVI
jgi:hypothetical protein